MPEGDTIHRHASQLGDRLLGHTVTALYARGVAYSTLVGTAVTHVGAHGKHLFIDLGSRARLHIHLGMTGRVRVLPRAELTTTAAARASLALATDNVAVIWTAARTAEVLRTAFAHAHPVLRALGPDVLGDTFDPAAVAARVRHVVLDTALDTTVGELLLDQRVASGIGNVYKSEVLFLERLDPWTPIARLGDDQLTRLYARARTLMRANVGAWPRTTTADLARGEWVPRGRGRLHVYRRHRRPCPACGSAIAMAYQGAPPRSTYYCPRCQSSSNAPAPRPESPPGDRG